MPARRSRAGALAILVACPAFTWAADVQLAAELGLGNSDNIRRTSDGDKAESMGQAALEIAVKQTLNALEAGLTTDLAYMRYLNGTYSNELIGSASGQAVFRLREERVRWTVLDNFGQAQRDLFAADTPENRENINYFSTGPDLLMRLGSSGQAQLNARYSRVDHETSPLDSNRYSGNLALARTFSRDASLSLVLQGERVDYVDDTAVNVDFDNSAFYVAYGAKGAQTTIALQAGANRISRSGATDSSPLVRLTLQRRLSASTTLTVRAGQELTDAANAFGAEGVTRNVSLDTLRLSTSGSPYEHRYLSAGWDSTGRRTRLGATVSYSRESYLEQSVLDRNLGYGELHLSRDLGSRLTMRILASFEKDQFVRTAGDFQELTATAGLTWRVSRRFRLDASTEHYDRTSEVIGGDYVETRYWLRLRYGDALVRGVGIFGPR